MPTPVMRHVKFIDRTETLYQPVIYQNDFWVTSKQYREINSTMKEGEDEAKEGRGGREGGGFLTKGEDEENNSISTLPLLLKYEVFGFWYWVIQVQLEDQWQITSSTVNVDDATMSNATNSNLTMMEQYMKSSTLTTDRETDLIREVLFDTNPVLLVVTATVSILHTIFDILAFRNDIQVCILV